MLKLSSFLKSGTSKSGQKITHIFVLSFLVVSIFTSGLFSAPQVTKAIDLNTSPYCYGIQKEGKAWPVGGSPFGYTPTGTPNSGIPYFGSDLDILMGNSPPITQPNFEACVRDTSGGAGTSFRIEGWAWDTNLGWISFYCPAGAGAMNQGYACSGSYTGGYGVTIDANGNFSGYAWSDNAGWISFNNPGYSQVKVDTSDPGCQGYVFGPTPPSSCTPSPSHTKQDTVAWSDNVGWMDFDGILLPWFTLTNQIDPTDVTVSISPDPSTLYPITKNPLPPYANGSDKYAIKLHIQTKKGIPVDPSTTGARYTVTAQPVWTKDTVKKDQTIPGANAGGTIDNKNCADPSGNAAVSKICGSLPSGPGLGDYSENVTSLAPTSDANGWDSTGSGTIDYPYGNFTVPSSLASNALQSNDLTFGGVNVSVYDNKGGACAFPSGPTCVPQLLNPTYVKSPYSGALLFQPQTNVTTLEDPTNNPKSISVLTQVPQSFPVTIQSVNPSPNVTFTAGIDPTQNPNYDLRFAHNPAETKMDYVNDSNTVTGSLSTTSLLGGIAVSTTGTPPAQYIPGEYIYSVVNEPNNVAYYSNYLPKSNSSLAIAPIAVLRGNVYSTGATATTTNQLQAVTNLGNVSTNILRDTIFKNVSSITAGATSKSFTSTDISYGDTTYAGGGFSEPAASTYGTYLLPSTTDGTYKVIYFNGGDIHISPSSAAAGDPFWCGQTTIIVLGGNVYIDGNIYNDSTQSSVKCADTSTQPRLGIIALKDLTSPNSQAAKGNVYISSNVSAVQANIFADGSVFSYGSEGVNSVTGEPVFSSVTDAQKVLQQYQLYIDGSIASQNTIGGSKKGILGSGASTPSQLEANLYDINYLRYYTGIEELDGSSNPYCNVDGNGTKVAVSVPSNVHVVLPGTGLPWTFYDNTNPGGCLFAPNDVTPGSATALGSISWLPSGLFDPLKDLGATYIYFDPPPATLPGFNSQSGGQQQQLQQ